MIGAGTLDFPPAVFFAAPKITAANNYPYFDAKMNTRFYCLADVSYNAEIKSRLFIASKRFSAYFEQYPLIYGLFPGHFAHPIHQVIQTLTSIIQFARNWKKKIELFALSTS